MLLKMFHRLTDAWIRHGPKQFVRLVGKNIITLPKHTTRRLMHKSVEFDRRLGIETDNTRALGTLGLDPRSESTRHAVPYEATVVSVFERALASLPIDPHQFTFLDYGSGKGRALILAAHSPFRQVIGVEFAQPLHKIAEENIRKASERNVFACRDVRAICHDALFFPAPEGPLVCYFNNPFGPPILERVISNLLHSLRESPRPLFIIYATPVHWGIIARSSAFELLERNDKFCTFRAKES